MNQKSNSQKNIKPNKTKPIHKYTSKPKLLKYKPAKGDQSKVWQIQGILNQRISLVPLQQPQKYNIKNSKLQINQSSINLLQKYQKIKQYEIAWVQNRSEGLWPNTWEPQENIPQETRLDYLLKKRNKLNEKKNPQQTSHFKTRQSLQKHIDFTMNKQEFGRRGYTTSQRRNQSNKLIKKVLTDKSPQKKKKSLDYKSWYYSFSSKVNEYQKMINRFLRNDRNSKPKFGQASNKKSKQMQNLKAEFIESVHNIKEQILDEGISQFIQKSEKSPNKTQNAREEETQSSYVPKKICLKLVKDIAFIGEVDNMNRFILKYYDDSIKFIRQDDLIKYLPHAYEKLMIKTIENQLKEAAEKLASTNPLHYHDGGRQLEELSYQTGLPKNYFWELQKQQQARKKKTRSNRFLNSPTYNNPLEFSFFHNENIKQKAEESQCQSNLPLQQQQSQQSDEQKAIQQLHIEKMSQIQRYFNSLSLRESDDLNPFNETSYIFNQTKSKISDDYKFINCKYLFPANSSLLNEWTKSKHQAQPQKTVSAKRQISLSQSRLKIENSLESLQSKQSRRRHQSNRKDKNNHKIEKNDIASHNRKGKDSPTKRDMISPTKGDTIAIQIDQLNSSKSLKKEGFQKHEKNPYKKVKINDYQYQEQEINKILGQIQETPTNKRKDEFYDSEDQSKQTVKKY